GWGLPRIWRGEFPPDGSYLERYAARFDAAEINSSFYRQHRRGVYERWAASVPPHFRFAVKVPRAITHDQTLVAADVLLEVFLEEVAGLGSRLGPLLVQLPPSLGFDAEHADEFFETLRHLHAGPVGCEPRHESWFAEPAEQLLRRHRVTRVAADPARVPAAANPGGDEALTYYRLHGSPRIYWSEYEPARLTAIAEQLRGAVVTGGERWCIFDNTTSGAATGNALALMRLLAE
ncbi:MAG TPA: DUF72 domain-containing protein, partial [Gemmatimonadaceae bacterium]|nr:DUF72 domain-containing protein [Gemmatimonadaceae bacterium]